MDFNSRNSSDYYLEERLKTILKYIFFEEMIHENWIVVKEKQSWQVRDRYVRNTCRFIKKN